MVGMTVLGSLLAGSRRYLDFSMLVSVLAFAQAACTVRDPGYYSEPPDAMHDGSSGDGSGDADPMQRAFDFGYISEWVVDGANHNAGEPLSLDVFVRIANVGVPALALSSGTVSGIADDNPTSFDVTDATWDAWDATPLLDPGRSAGALSPQIELLVVGSGIMAEPVQDSTTSAFRITVANFPSSAIWVTVNLSIAVSIQNARGVLAIRLRNGTSDPPMSPAPGVATRVSSSPL
jgi:hypothetical protein